MQTVELLGAEFPLCLTVAAVERLQGKGLRLGDIAQLYTTGEGRDIQTCVENTLWLLEVLMQGGQDNGLIRGETIPDHPSLDDLRHLMTPGQGLHHILPQVVMAVNDGLGRTAEADHEKNGADAADSP